MRRPAAPKIDEAVVTAALERSRPLRSAGEAGGAVKQRLPRVPSLASGGLASGGLASGGLASGLQRERSGDVTFVRLSRSEAPVPFAIGNLYGRSVKSWATARTTRRGLFATLRAPHYRHSMRLPAPAAVYAVGFRKQRRQRTDSFSGTSMLKVRYQELAQLTR